MSLYIDNLLSRPLGQGIGAFVLFAALTVLAQFTKLLGLFPIADWSSFLFGGMSLLLFAILNSLTFLRVTNNDSYFNKSLPVFIGLAFAIILVCRVVGGLWIHQMGYYQWIYTVVAVSYLLLITIMRAIRGVMTIAQREDEKYQASFNKTKPKE